MQDIPLSYTMKPITAVRKSRFNDPAPIITPAVGYYKRINRSIVFIPVSVETARTMELTNEMFFEEVSKDDTDLPDSDEDVAAK